MLKNKPLPSARRLAMRAKLGSSLANETARVVQSNIQFNNQSVTYIANKSGLCRATVFRLLSGSTRNPQSSTCRMALRAVGYDLTITKKEK